MADISEELHKGEKLEKEFVPSPWEYFGWYVLGGFFLLFGIIPGLIILLVAEGVRRGHGYYITDKRIIYQFTFLSRKTSSATYGKLQDIHFTQNVIERIFGIGKVHMNTAGTHLVEIVFKGVQNPVNVKRLVEHHMMRKKK